MSKHLLALVAEQAPPAQILGFEEKQRRLKQLARRLDPMIERMFQ